MVGGAVCAESQPHLCQSALGVRGKHDNSPFAEWVSELVIEDVKFLEMCDTYQINYYEKGCCA